MNCSSNETGTAPGAAGLRPDVASTRPDPPKERFLDGPAPSSRGRRGAVVLIAALIASLSALQPAYADTRRFSDPKGDSGLPADITSVRVTNGPDLIEVAMRPGRVRIGDQFTFWLDTRAEDAGPEYAVGLLPNSDALGITRVDGFDQQGTVVVCDELRGTADYLSPKWVSVSLPRSCVGDPGAVRVAAEASYTDGDDSVVDWAPASRTFFGWVAL